MLFTAVAMVHSLPPVSAQAVYTGQCLLTLTTTAPTPLLPTDLLTPTVVTVNGHGPCVVIGPDLAVDQTAQITVGGTLTTIEPPTLPATGAWSCAGGVAARSLTYTVSGVPAVTAHTTVVATAVDLSLVAVDTNPAYDGTGKLVRTTTDDATQCVNGTATSLTWTGPFAFVLADGVGIDTDPFTLLLTGR